MMARQGSCLDPTSDALTVLDRLAGLSKVISPAVMEQALLDTAGPGTCLHVVAPCHALGGVGHGRATDLPIRQVFKHARRMQPGDKAPARDRCEARYRLGVSRSNASSTSWSTAGHAADASAFYHGLPLRGIDGTVLMCLTRRPTKRTLAAVAAAAVTRLPTSPQGQPSLDFHDYFLP